jgi:UDP-glucuronate 4-epimerase
MGRPDMAYFSFTNRYFAGQPIKIFNNGDRENDLYRDFTYIDDIVEGILRLLCNPPETSVGFDRSVPAPDSLSIPQSVPRPDPLSIPQWVPHRLFNIGNSEPVSLMTFIETLEKCLGRAAGRTIEFEKTYAPMQPGDLPVTCASTELLDRVVGFKPHTPLETGLQNFADWYMDYYRIQRK